MKNKSIIIVFFVIMFFGNVSFSATFKGKIIDADNKEPIEGAVVVASWNEERATPTGPTTRLNEVKETLTDKNGEWKIEGSKGGDIGNIKAIFSFLTGMYFTNLPEFIVFKPAYCSLPKGFGIDSCKEKMRKSFVGIGQGQTVELLKLTNRDERILNQGIGLEYDGKDILKKQKNLIRLLNEERKMLGFPVLTVLEDTEK